MTHDLFSQSYTDPLVGSARNSYYVSMLNSRGPGRHEHQAQRRARTARKGRPTIRYNRCISLDGKHFYGLTGPCQVARCKETPWGGYQSCFCEPLRCTFSEYIKVLESIYPPPSEGPLVSSIPDMLRANVLLGAIAECHKVSEAYVKRMAMSLRLDWCE